jgi:probable F420-dependent oxidoreductase
MKIGAIYPQTELDGDIDCLRRFTLAVEEMGYDHIVFYDHVGGFDHAERDPPLEGGKYNESDPFHDPLVAFAYLAGITERIEFHTGVLVAPQRQTVLLAKQAADVQLMSNGRLRLCVGTGWNYLEYRGLNEDFHTRGKKLDEQIVFLRKLWTERSITFEGKFHNFVRGSILPRPDRAIPIYVGGFIDAAYRRGARLGDGFLFVLGVGDAIADWCRLQVMLREEGRPVEGFGAQFVMTLPALAVDPRNVCEHALRLRDENATAISIGSLDRGLATVDQHLEFLAEARANLATALR